MLISNQGILIVVAGVLAISITPCPSTQTHLLVLLSTGFPPCSTVGLPGAHGAGTTGVQAIGVNAPPAAAVAAATPGFVKELHSPNGNLGTSIIVAIG